MTDKILPGIAIVMIPVSVLMFFALILGWIILGELAQFITLPALPFPALPILSIIISSFFNGFLLLTILGIVFAIEKLAQLALRKHVTVWS